MPHRTLDLDDEGLGQIPILYAHDGVKRDLGSSYSSVTRSNVKPLTTPISSPTLSTLLQIKLDLPEGKTQSKEMAEMEEWDGTEKEQRRNKKIIRKEGEKKVRTETSRDQAQLIQTCARVHIFEMCIHYHIPKMIQRRTMHIASVSSTSSNHHLLIRWVLVSWDRYM